MSRIDVIVLNKRIENQSVANKTIVLPDFPTNINIEWIDDYAQITFTDNTYGESEHEVWEGKDGGEYILVKTLTYSQTKWIYRTWQNSTLKFKLRSVKNGIHSSFGEEKTIITPLVFKMNQSILSAVTIQGLQMNGVGYTLVIDWGDNTTTNFTSNVSIPVNKNYLVTGNYFVKFSGDVNNIREIEWFSASAQLAGTDITRWNYPTNLYFSHLYDNGFTGNITNIEYPANCIGLHLGGNNLIADITDWEFPSVYWDMHIQYVDWLNSTTGDLSGWDIGGNNANTIAHLNIRGNINADLSSWRPWVSTPYPDILLNLLGNNFYGDLSGWTIPDKTCNLTTYGGCKFTGLPRGNFRRVYLYRFRDNACDSAEIDAILAYIDAYFVGGVVPLTNCTYWLDGTGMGSPSAAGLASIASIQAKYVLAGFVATISVNP